MRRLGLVMATVVLVGCSAANTDSTQPQELRCASPVNPSPKLGETFSLRYQQSATVAGEGLKLVFAKVAEDSRCPKDVQCVWEGNGRVEVTAAKAGSETQTLELNTSSRYKASAAYLTYRIAMTGLAPYPSSAHPIGPSDYCVELRVTQEN
jgi:hypothetical protein